MADVQTNNTDEIELLGFQNHLYDRDGDHKTELILVDPQHGPFNGNLITVSRRAAILTEFFRAVQAEPQELRRFADLTEDGSIILLWWCPTSHWD